jgi:hypothetical protein
MRYPGVSLEQTAAFAKAWDKSGLKILLDKTSIEFAHDWANIVLKSYVDDMVAKAQAAAKLKAQVQSGKENPGPAPAAEKPKSSIILTD